ncbi:BTAD domain-containing putative transcriptional regulator [Krasilnikovia sp. MM14-A1259]|uniref:BTAD domain-containing putative transcriptional regulator n=1 Tax=Krasilnikovia sp. MM14-A1259 TaxID=3373539 RepID=UPI00381313F5
MFRVAAALGRLLRALAALAVLVGFLAGVPWLLTASAGWPLDWIGWPSLAQVPGLSDLYTAVTSPWSDQMIVDLLASVGWVLWLIFLRDVLVEVIEASAGAARHGSLRAPVARRGPIRWVAAVLVGAIVGAVLFDAARAALTGTGVPSAAAAVADAAARRPAVAVAPAQRTVAPAVLDQTWLQSRRTSETATSAPAKTAPLSQAPTHHRRGIPAWARDAPGGVHHVARGDNLWDIADHQLGDPHRWREIYTLNRGHVQANGYALTDPDEIHVGWVLAMPARDATPAPAAPAAKPHTVTPPPGTPGAGPAPHASATPPPASGDAAPAPAPQTPTPTRTEPSMPPASTTPPASPSAPTASTPSAISTSTGSANATDSATSQPTNRQREETGVNLPSRGWVSLGLAALIASVASLLRLQRRRRARLTFPIPTRFTAQPAPVPEALAPADTAGARHLAAEDVEPHRPPTPAILAPIGVDADGAEVSLFDLPAPGLALTGAGAEAAARAVLASALATGATEILEQRPVVVTTVEVLARLLPDGAPLVGLDPDGTTYDGERLIILDEVAAAVTHAEEEMVLRRRLLDTFDVDSIAALNARTDHAEAQQPYVQLIEAAPRHAARLLAVGAHKAALHLHPVILGPLDGVPTVEVRADGTVTGESAEAHRLSTLTGDDLAAVMSMLTDAAARPELGHDIDDPTPEIASAAEAPAEPAEPVPAQPAQAPGIVRLTVLGPVTVATEAGPVTTGMRSGSFAVLCLLAVHPAGRTLDQLGADLHPDTNPSTAANRVRTDIGTIRRVLRTATSHAEAMFVVHDPATGRYRLDPDLVTVDLWQMLTAIEHANRAEDDEAALTALRDAAELYAGDFADGGDQTWITDHATTYRHQILAVYARIAEIVEPDHPDQAVAVLDRALEFDSVNEELYQRIMRIHGRAGRPDVVRRTLRRLEQRLAELGDAEPSQATRRVAERQLRPTTTAGGRP